MMSISHLSAVSKGLFLNMSLLVFGFWIALGHCDEPEVKITYEDHVKPIFREHCMACHYSGDKSGGLALDTYGATLEGGGGGRVIDGGNLDGSRLWGIINHTAQPFMPPDSDKIPQDQLELIRQWIDQGILENSGSAPKKAKANVALAGVVKLGRPEGEPPMPEFGRKQPPVYSERSAAIAALSASPWAPVVAIGGQKQVSLYHTIHRTLLGILPFPEGEPQSIRFSQDGQLVLVGGGRHSHSGCAVLYDLKSGERITKIGDELDIVFSADISEDRRKVALAGPQKMVRVYDTATGNLLYEQKKHTDWIYAVRFSPDGTLLASADRSNGLVLWEADTGRLYLDLIGHKGEIRSLTWTPDSNALVTASLDGTIKMWELQEGRLIKSVDAHGGGVASIEVSNDGTFVSTGMDNKVKIWDAGLNLVGEAPIADSGLEAAISVDSKQIFAGDWSGNVTGWNRDALDQPFALRANPPTLEATLASAEAELRRAENELLNVATHYAELQAQLEAKRAAMETADSDEARATLNNELQSLAEQQSQKLLQQLHAVATLKARQDAVSIAQSDLQRFVDYREKLLTRDNELKVRTSEIEQQIGELQTQLVKTSDSQTALKSLGEMIRNEIAKLQQALAENDMKMAESESQIRDLKQNMDQLVMELETIQAESVSIAENRESFVRAYGEPKK